MIHLVYGQRLDHLLATWAERDRASAPTELSGPTVLASSPQAGRWARAWWARQNGVAARWSIRSLRGLLEERVAAAHGRRLPSAPWLELLLVERLYGREPLPEALERYLDRAGHPAEAHRRRLQVAVRLARALDTAALGATKWSAGWPAEVAGWAEATLRDPRLICWQDAFARPRDLELPAELLILDAFEPHPALAAALARVGAVRDLWLLALNPCAEFWEDLPVRRPTDALPSRSAPLLPGVDPAPSENPLLTAWGSSGRRRMAELNRLTDCDFIAAYAAPGSQTRLERVQADVLARRAPAAPRPDEPGDDSIAIVQTRSVRDEAERVAARIWALLDADPSLRLNDVLVALPSRDAPELRAALHAAFARHHGLAWHDLDVAWADRGRVVAAFRALLDLARDGVTGEGVRRLLEHPAVAYDGSADEREDARRWIARLRVIDGRDRAAHAGTYIDRDVLNWEQGLRRLALGLVFADDDRPELVGSDGDLASYVPLGGASTEGVGRFWRWVQRLFRDLEPLARGAREPAAWAPVLRALLDRHLAPLDEADERERAVLLDVLDDLEAAPGAARVPFPVARALVDDRLEARRHDDAGAFFRGVTVAPLSRCAGLPYEACFVVGLTEDVFPRASPDGARETSDRFDLLVRLTSTRRWFWLSCASGDAGARPPSSVLTELQEVLTRGYGASVDGAPREVPSPSALRRAWALDADGAAGAAIATPPPVVADPSPPPAGSVSRATLADLLFRPDRAWRRGVLGIRPPEPEAPLREVFRAGPRAVESIARGVLASWPDVRPEDVAHHVERALDERAATEAIPVGLYGRAEARRIERTLKRWLEAMWSEGVPAAPPLAEPDRVRCARPSGGLVEIRGAPPLAFGDPSGPRTAVTVLGQWKQSADVTLCRAFVEHVIANLAGPRASVVLTLDGSGQSIRHELRPIGSEASARWIDGACTDLWTLAHDVNFPFAVARDVLAARRAGRDEDIPRLLARARTLDPAADAEGREPPDPDVAASWASRRLDLLERSLVRP